MDTVLAIDQSTSATKALILDLRAGRVLAKASGEPRAPRYPPQA
jgi:sugar (pentulose or hexulose) kinase